MDLDDFKTRLSKLAELKDRKAATAKADKEAEQEPKQFQADLWQDMAEAGIDSVKADGGRFTRQQTPYGVITDRDAFLAWCEENGVDGLTQEVEVKQRLNELVRDRLNNNEELPPGTSFFPRQYISYTKK